MPALPGPDLTAIRTKPVGRLFNLYVWDGEIIWQGTVGGAPEQGDTDITVATTFGNPANIQDGYTGRVTDSTNNPKLAPSKVRCRSHAGVVLTVGLNAIDWVVGDLITVVRLYEIWPKIPYIDPNAVEQYKDGDIQYTDDNTAQPPKANAGCAAIGVLVGGQVDIVFANRGSFVCPVGGAVTSYLWSDDGGTPAVVAGGAATATVTYRYTTAGYYYVDLQVTDANGKTGVKHTPVIIDDGTLAEEYFVPGDRYWDKFGWVLSRRLKGIDATTGEYNDGDPVFLAAADTAQTADAAFYVDRSNVRWAGWLQEDTTARTYYSDEVVYRAVSSCHVLANIPAFPTGYRTSVDPDADYAADIETAWYNYTQLSMDSVVYLLMHWHSTAMQVCDFLPTGEWNNRLRPGENCEADSLLGQVDHVLEGVIGNLRCERQGTLLGMRHEWHLSAAEFAARATVMTIARGDYQGVRWGPHPHRAKFRECRALGVDAGSNPFMAGAPPFPLDGGTPIELPSLAPADQTELNRWAGQHLAWRNWAVPAVIRMTGEYDVVDPAKGELIAGNLSDLDIILPKAPYSVQGVRFIDDHDRQLSMSEWILVPDPKAYLGATREIPDDPPPPPPPPPPENDVPPPVVEPIYAEVWVATKEEGVYYTIDFSDIDGPMPTWIEHNAGLPDENVYQFAYDRANDPERRFFLLNDDSATNDEYDCYRCEGLGNWALIMDIADAAAITGVGPGGGARLDWVTVDEVTGRVWILYRNNDGSLSRMFLLYSDANGDPLPGVWSFVEFATAGADFYNRRACVRAYDSDILVFAMKSNIVALGGLGTRGHNMYYSSDNGATWNFIAIHVTTTGYNYCGGGQHSLNPTDKGYGRRWDTLATDYDFVSIDGVIQIVEFAENINPLPDCFWFSRLSSDIMRVLRRGAPGTYLPTIFETSDDWLTTDSQWNLPYYNIDMCADLTHYRSDEWMLWGADNPDSGLTLTTQHHILLSSAVFNIADLVAKAGDNVGTPPYVDSIPETGNGVCIDGIQVVPL